MVREAVDIIKAGGVVVYPTDSAYALSHFNLWLDDGMNECTCAYIGDEIYLPSLTAVQLTPPPLVPRLLGVANRHPHHADLVERFADRVIELSYDSPEICLIRTNEGLSS